MLTVLQINSIKIMAHHPRKWEQAGELPDSEREYLWRASIKLLEGLNLAHSSRQLQRFMWHTRVHFVWQAFIYVLNELKDHPLRNDADKGWAEVEEIYRHHPHFISDYRKPLHIAVGSLCLKAYAVREQTLRERTNGVFPKVTPGYILQLRELREKGPLRRTAATAFGSSEAGAGKLSHIASGYETTNADAFSTTVEWENTLPPTHPSSAGDAYFTTDTSSTHGFRTGPGTSAQLPLPAFQPMPPASDGGFIFASEPEPSAALDLAMADVDFNWAQWDLMMKDMANDMAR